MLDLKYLNKFIKLRHFKMESLRSNLEALQLKEYIISIDVKEAYFHVLIFSGHRRFL